MLRYARILIDRTEGTLLDYLIPEALVGKVVVGSRVRVPLRHTEALGVVLEILNQISFSKVKAILGLVTSEEAPLLSPVIMKLAHWMAEYYCASLSSVLRSLLPGTIREDSAEKKVRVVSLLKKPLEEVLERLAKRAPKQKTLLDILEKLSTDDFNLKMGIETGDLSQYTLSQNVFPESSRTVKVCHGSVKTILEQSPYEISSSSIPVFRLKVPVARLLEQAQATASSLASLVKEGWVAINEESVERDPFAGEELLPSIIPKLNADQERVVAVINEELSRLSSSISHLPSSTAAAVSPASSLQPTTSIQSSSRIVSLPFLLHGVTGSGKTEVYLRAMEQALALGKSALILVPEIALTPQTVERFRARFDRTQGKRLIAVLHSHLSEGERRDEWLRLHRGEARIAIGARSAVFAPLCNLGLIIVDEEHETSYKQEETPRYHARDVAVVRAGYEGCPIILGSATPSIESYQNTRLGKYRLLELPHRADHQRMPLVRVLDLRLQVRGKGADGVLSFPLRQAIKARLELSEQVILFLNRRGFASSLICHQCGHVCHCPNCSLALTFHRVTNQLICHLCGYVQKPPSDCPECREPGILHAGVGTQRVEAAVQQAFPGARLFRMDTDTMKQKGSYREVLDRFRKNQIDILIGTQMIAKGLDFPNVTLVGIINADKSLYAPDFRAGEI